MRPLYFWVSAGIAAAVLSLAVALLFPYRPLGIETAADRERAWLLTIWTSGVLAICFGASGLLGPLSVLGFRDVAEAGSVGAAIDARRETRHHPGPSAFYNFAGWTMSTGIMLLVMYFGGWLNTG